MVPIAPACSKRIHEINKQMLNDFQPAVKNVALTGQNLMCAYHNFTSILEDLSKAQTAYTAALYGLSESARSADKTVKEYSEQLQSSTEILKKIHEEHKKWITYFCNLTIFTTQNNKLERGRLKELNSGFIKREKELKKAVNKGKVSRLELGQFYEDEYRFMKTQQANRYRFFALRYRELVQRHADFTKWSTELVEKGIGLSDDGGISCANGGAISDTNEQKHLDELYHHADEALQQLNEIELNESTALKFQENSKAWQKPGSGNDFEHQEEMVKGDTSQKSEFVGSQMDAMHSINHEVQTLKNDKGQKQNENGNGNLERQYSSSNGSDQKGLSNSKLIESSKPSNNESVQNVSQEQLDLDQCKKFAQSHIQCRGVSNPDLAKQEDFQKRRSLPVDSAAHQEHFKVALSRTKVDEANNSTQNGSVQYYVHPSTKSSPGLPGHKILPPNIYRPTPIAVMRQANKRFTYHAEELVFTSVESVDRDAVEKRMSMNFVPMADYFEDSDSATVIYRTGPVPPPLSQKPVMDQIGHQQQNHRSDDSRVSNASQSSSMIVLKNSQQVFSTSDYGRLVECTTAYHAQGDTQNQLSLEVGDQIVLIKCGTRGWALGRSMDGNRHGWFPAKFLKLV